MCKIDKKKAPKGVRYTSKETLNEIKKYSDTLNKPSGIINADIENNFKYHAPKEGQPEIYASIQDKAKELAYYIDEVALNSREKSLAMTKLEEVVMWANAAIARN